MTDSEKLDALLKSQQLLLEGQGKIMEQVINSQKSVSRTQESIINALSTLSENVKTIRTTGKDTNLKTELIQKMFDQQLGDVEEHLEKVDVNINNFAGYMNRFSQNMEMLTNQIGDLQYGKQQIQQRQPERQPERRHGLPEHIID